MCRRRAQPRRPRHDCFLLRLSPPAGRGPLASAPREQGGGGATFTLENRPESPSPGSDFQSSPPSPRKRGEGRKESGMNTELGRKLASAAFIVGIFLLWEVLCLAFNVS